METSKVIEKACIHCKAVLEDDAEYNYTLVPAPCDEDDYDESHLRQMEDYAAYRAAGCTSEYWTDRDEGYAH
jgi:hypothetical protein